MSAGPVDTVREAGSGPQVAGSAVVIGAARLGEKSLLAQGAVVRSTRAGVEVGTGSAVLENCVIVGTTEIPARIGRRTVFGHRCTVVGASVGDLCEIGNASVLMPRARIGDRVFLGEGTLVPGDMTLPSDVVAVGRPAWVLRTASDDDVRRLAGLRDGDLSIPPPTAVTVASTQEASAMGQLYPYRGIAPSVDASATLFPTAEITGDVVVGERTIIGAGVKIIGDSHGPVRIGNDVQILENTVLHLLPDNDLIIDDRVIIGPGAMIHGCRIGAGSVVEPGAIVCDHSVLGPGCVVRAGAVVKQRSRFDPGTEIDGFPAVGVAHTSEPPEVPRWAWQRDDLRTSQADHPSDDRASPRPRRRVDQYDDTRVPRRHSGRPPPVDR
jgi:carbonic anhydrase/acetyltransferase-like protein (isoleucine patch superfamily)